MSLTTSITVSDFETLQNNIHQNILVTLNQFFSDCLRKNCLFSIVYEDGRVLITVDGVKLDPQITPPKPEESLSEKSSSVISNDNNCFRRAEPKDEKRAMQETSHRIEKKTGRYLKRIAKKAHIGKTTISNKPNKS